MARIIGRCPAKGYLEDLGILGLCSPLTNLPLFYLTPEKREKRKDEAQPFFSFLFFSFLLELIADTLFGGEGNRGEDTMSLSVLVNTQYSVSVSVFCLFFVFFTSL